MGPASKEGSVQENLASKTESGKMETKYTVGGINNSHSNMLKLNIKTHKNPHRASRVQRS